MSAALLCVATPGYLLAYGPVSSFAAGFGKLYVTRDGGQQRQLVTP